jgi:hypothetical protein
MKRYLALSILIGAMTLSSAAMAQPAVSTPMSYLQASLAAMVGQSSIQDVTLTGNAEVIAGGNDETVPVTFKALSNGSTGEQLNLSAGVMNEVRIYGSSGPTGTWTSGDGVQHTISGQNLITGSAWFSPAIVISQMISNPALTLVYVGGEGGLFHFQVYQQQPNASGATGELLQHLTQMDIYLSSTTLEPVTLQFNAHAESNANVDVPVTIQYSNYQTVNGVSMPFRVQRFFNNSLALDFQIQSADINSGITVAALSAK